jgi:hypothetical protein
MDWKKELDQDIKKHLARRNGQVKENNEPRRPRGPEARMIILFIFLALLLGYILFLVATH